MVLTKENKMFARMVNYSQVNPNNFNDLLDKFKKRIDWWYIRPGKALRKKKYTGFIVMGISCIIIDTLCGYRYGIDEKNYNGRKPGDTTKKEFINFCKEYFPELRKKPPKNCQLKYSELRNLYYADVLYESYRCKILHEARISYYGGISEDPPVNTRIIGYDNVNEWIVINPHLLLQKVKEVLDDFIIQVKNGRNEKEFKRRFRFVFDEEIDTSVWGNL